MTDPVRDALAELNDVIGCYWITAYQEGKDNRNVDTPNGPAGRGYMILPGAVTHWMPLPDAPTGEQQP